MPNPSRGYMPEDQHDYSVPPPCPRGRHSEADKGGPNGVVYVVCTECGETLTRAPDDRQLSANAREELRRFAGNRLD